MESGAVHVWIGVRFHRLVVTLRRIDLPDKDILRGQLVRSQIWADALTVASALWLLYLAGFDKQTRFQMLFPLLTR